MVARVAYLSRVLLVALVAVGIEIAGPTSAHTPDGFNTNTSPTSVLLTASGQLSSPTNGNTYTGSVTFSSSAPHYINVKNNASGRQTVTYSYDMELILDD